MSFSQALSGLNAAARNLDVIGNNIANVNTVGSKSSRVEFQDMYAASVGEGKGAVGSGVNASVIAQEFSQGSIRSTGNETDLAINGKGFFQLSDGSSPAVYSRNGQFKIDAEGFIVNNQQLKLMGYQAGLNGTIVSGTAAPIQIPNAALEPKASSAIKLEFNLDSRASVPVTPAFNPADATSYNNATSSTVYDTLGNPITLSTYFQKASNDNWNVYATANGQAIGTGSIATLNYSTPGVSPVVTGVAPATSVGVIVTLPDITDPAIPPNFKTLTGLTLNLGTSTQVASGFAVSQLSVDGSAPAAMVGFSIGSDGTIASRYANGQTKTVGMIELADFRNPQGLQPMGSNAWAQTRASGVAISNTPGEGQLGALQSGAVEDSNVDLTAELVSMMTAQRAYQANAQTIKTQDQVMSTLVNLR